jgi:tetratricopeptide (TPR) repeat protein
LSEEGNSAEAIQEAKEAKRISLKAFGAMNKETSSAEEAEGRALESAGRVEEALAAQREALRVRAALLPRDHPMVVRTEVSVARMLVEHGEPAAALPIIGAVEAKLTNGSEARLGKVSARIQLVKADVLAAMNQLPEAQLAADRAVDSDRRLFQSIYAPQILAEAMAARIHLLRGQLDVAASQTEAAKRELEAIPGHGELQAAALNVLLGACRREQHREPEARALLDAAIPVLLASKDAHYGWERNWVRSHAPEQIQEGRAK